MATSSVASFTPITVTAETLGVLAKEDNYAELLCLYMAYVEITSWQHKTSIKATRDFMAQRLRWRPDKVSRVKKKLIELGLVRDLVKKSEEGKVLGHYILVQYVVKNHLLSIGATGLEEQHVLGATNTSKQQGNTSKQKGSEELYVVFEELKRILGTSGKYTLTDTRRSHLKKRLSEFTKEELYTAARKLSVDEWCSGENPRGKKYAYPHFLIRSQDKVEEWLNDDTPTAPDPENRGRLKVDAKSINWDEV